MNVFGLKKLFRELSSIFGTKRLFPKKKFFKKTLLFSVGQKIVLRIPSSIFRHCKIAKFDNSFLRRCKKRGFLET